MRIAEPCHGAECYIDRVSAAPHRAKKVRIRIQFEDSLFSSGFVCSSSSRLASEASRELIEPATPCTGDRAKQSETESCEYESCSLIFSVLDRP